jgi:hypothetical protein
MLPMLYPLSEDDILWEDDGEDNDDSDWVTDSD